MSYRLNNLFAFSAIRTQGHFIQFQGIANMVLEGQVYYWLIDMTKARHSMYWFLYDENTRVTQARELSIPQGCVETVWAFLEQINPYIHHLQRAVSLVDNEATPLAIELSVLTAGGNIAAIINTEGLCHVSPRLIMFFCHGGLQLRFVPILFI